MTALSIATTYTALLYLFILASNSIDSSFGRHDESQQQPICEKQLLQFLMNWKYLQAEFFLNGATGYGVDAIDPDMSMGGPTPSGTRKANLDVFTSGIMEQFGRQQIGHLRSIIHREGTALPRPPMDLSVNTFGRIFDSAFQFALTPPFDPYRDVTHFLLASYLLSSAGVTGLVGVSTYVNSTDSGRLLAGILGVDSGQAEVIGTLLFQRAQRRLYPYTMAVGDFTSRLSWLVAKLAGSDAIKDGRQTQPLESNSRSILQVDRDSLAYHRTPREMLRILYASGNESRSGGFFPLGAGGVIAQSFMPGPESTTCAI